MTRRHRCLVKTAHKNNAGGHCCPHYGNTCGFHPEHEKPREDEDKSQAGFHITPPRVRLVWHCSYFVGPAYWHNTEDYEPDECDTDFEAEVDAEDYENGEASAECPACHSMLHQWQDDPEVIE